MKTPRQQVRALCLLSGGLDSQIAAAVLREQGIDLHGVMFSSPLAEPFYAEKAAARLGVPIRTDDFTAPLVKLLERSSNGGDFAGAVGMAYCTEMMRRARQLVEELNCHFICTGDVLNQRSPVQSKSAFMRVDHESRCQGEVLRPLSARMLPETKPERKGWVERSGLLALQGADLRTQEELARRFEITAYRPDPIFSWLFDKTYVKRLQDLIAHEGLQGARSLSLLRLGRHFRLTEKVKLVVGRNENENALLEGMAELYDIVLKVEDARGPTGIIPFTASEEEIELAAAVVARYSDTAAAPKVMVRVREPRALRRVAVTPERPQSVDRLRIEVSETYAQ